MLAGIEKWALRLRRKAEVGSWAYPAWIFWHGMLCTIALQAQQVDLRSVSDSPTSSRRGGRTPKEAQDRASSEASALAHAPARTQFEESPADTRSLPIRLHLRPFVLPPSNSWDNSTSQRPLCQAGWSARVNGVDIHSTGLVSRRTTAELAGCSASGESTWQGSRTCSLARCALEAVALWFRPVRHNHQGRRGGHSETYQADGCTGSLARSSAECSGNSPSGESLLPRAVQRRPPRPTAPGKRLAGTCSGCRRPSRAAHHCAQAQQQSVSTPALGAGSCARTTRPCSTVSMTTSLAHVSREGTTLRRRGERWPSTTARSLLTGNTRRWDL